MAKRTDRNNSARTRKNGTTLATLLGRGSNQFLRQRLPLPSNVASYNNVAVLRFYEVA